MFNDCGHHDVDFLYVSDPNDSIRIAVYLDVLNISYINIEKEYNRHKKYEE